MENIGHGRAAATEHLLDLAWRMARAASFGRACSNWLAMSLTMPQFKVLLLVVDEGVATGGHIARGLGVGPSTVTGIVDRLCEHGLVTRADDADDRRVTCIRPTKAGQALVEELWSYRRDAFAQVLALVSDDDLGTLERAAEHLVAAAEANWQWRTRQGGSTDTPSAASPILAGNVDHHP